MIVLRTILLAAYIAASAPAQNPPAMPSWLTPFPGAAEATRQNSVLVESSYTAPARPGEVLDHYRQLFAAARLPFRPSAMGYRFTIRADTGECNLTIVIRNRNDSSDVRVTCSAIVGPRTGAAAARAEQSERQRVDAMEKFDRPVYPAPRSPRTPVEWPPWLVHVQGARLAVHDLTGAAGPGYQRAAYTTRTAVPDVLEFYESLLAANSFHVDSRNPASPATRRSWLQASGYPDGRPGRRVVIRVEIMPAGNASSVELRVTEFR